MTQEEQAQIERWQHTDGGRAELGLHALAMAVDDLEGAACTREGFAAIRHSRAMMIKARESLAKLIDATSLFHAEAAE